MAQNKRYTILDDEEKGTNSRYTVLPDENLTPTGLPLLGSDSEFSSLRGVPLVPAPIADIATTIGKKGAELATGILTKPSITAPAIGGAVAGFPGMAAMTPIGVAMEEAIERAPTPTTTEELISQVPITGLPITTGLRLGRTDITGKELVGRVGKELIINSLFDLAGYAVLKGSSKGVRGALQEDVLPAAKAAQETVKKTGGQLNLAQITDNRVVDFADKIARSGVLSSERMAKADLAIEKGLTSEFNSIADDLVKKVGRKLSRPEIQEMLDSAFDVGQTSSRAIEKVLYDRLDDLTVPQISTKKLIKEVPEIDPLTGGRVTRRIPEEVDITVGGVTVPTKKLKEFALKELEASTARSKIGVTPRLKSELVKILNLNDTIPFSVAQDIRSSYIRIGKEAADQNLASTAKRLSSVTDTMMEDAASNLSGDARQAWRRANNFYKKGKDVFEDDFVAKLFLDDKKMAEDVGKAIYKNGRVTTVEKTKRWLKLASDRAKAAEKLGLTDRDGELIKSFDLNKSFNAVRQGYNTAFIEKHFIPDQTSELIGPNKVRGRINWQGMLNDFSTTETQESLKSLYPKEHIRKMKDLIEAGQLYSAKSPGSTGAFQLMQMGALASVPKGIASAGLSAEKRRGIGTALIGATEILGFPQTVAKFLNSPSAIQYLTTGFKEMSKGTEQAIKLGVSNTLRAIRILLDDDVRDKTKRWIFGQLEFQNSRNE